MSCPNLRFVVLGEHHPVALGERVDGFGLTGRRSPSSSRTGSSVSSMPVAQRRGRPTYSEVTIMSANALLSASHKRLEVFDLGDAFVEYAVGVAAAGRPARRRADLRSTRQRGIRLCCAGLVGPVAGRSRQAVQTASVVVSVSQRFTAAVRRRVPGSRRHGHLLRRLHGHLGPAEPVSPHDHIAESRAAAPHGARRGLWSIRCVASRPKCRRPVNPVTRSRSVSAVTARRGMLDAIRPNRLPSAVFASGDRNANGWCPSSSARGRRISRPARRASAAIV